jgi:hypothetical protein
MECFFYSTSFCPILYVPSCLCVLVAITFCVYLRDTRAWVLPFRGQGHATLFSQYAE